MIKATLIVALVLLFSVAVMADASTHTAGWKSFLRQQIPILGHRNWIVIADSAYPAQNSSGITTVETGATQVEVVQEVMRQLATAKHVAPIIYLDAELKHLNDSLAPGVDHYKNDLHRALNGHATQSLLHMDLINKLDESGKTFKVVILKTNMTLPYTSVFINLDCKYWGPAKEKQLREIMKKH